MDLVSLTGEVCFYTLSFKTVKTTLGANLRQIFGNRRAEIGARRKLQDSTTQMQNDVTQSDTITPTEPPEITEPMITAKTLPLEQFWLVQNDTDSGERLNNEQTKFDRLFANRNDQRKKSKKFEQCYGVERPELKCDNCKPGYPYYDCEEKGTKGFKCKIECSSSKSHRPLTFQKKIKCRSTGWKKNYGKTIRCIERA